MPWPKERKGKTRQRIVQAAASAFRKQGIADVGIAELMKQAGLTHGGFYAHFSSKEDLLAQALAHASNQVSATLRQAAVNQPSPSALLSISDAYLSPKHLQHPEAGCPVAALGPELVRSTANVRQTLAKGIRARLQALVDLVPDDLPYREILDVASPYLGPCPSVQTNWTPLESRSRLFGKWGTSPVSEADVWQFASFVVEP